MKWGVDKQGATRSGGARWRGCTAGVAMPNDGKQVDGFWALFAHDGMNNMLNVDKVARSGGTSSMVQPG